MNSGPVQSESLRFAEDREQARMTHVLDALRIGQKNLAEELFSRVSKRVVQEEIERHKSNSLVDYPTPKRIVGTEDATPVLFFVTEQRVISRLDTLVKYADLPGCQGVGGSKSLDSLLEVTARSIGDTIGMRFTGAPQAYLIDALTTSIEALDQNLWSFRWKQKYAI